MAVQVRNNFEMKDFPDAEPVPVIETLKDLAEILHNNPQNTSITKEFLTNAVLKRYTDSATAHGVRLAHMIRNCALDKTALGPFAGDAYCYDIFTDFIGCVLSRSNGIYDDRYLFCEENWGFYDERCEFQNITYHSEYILQSKLSARRNIAGYRFIPTIGRENMYIVERDVARELSQMKDEYRGFYFNTQRIQKDLMEEYEQRQIIPEHDKNLHGGLGCRYNPEARGVYQSDSCNFIAWVNFQDHLEVTTWEQNGNIQDVYFRMAKAMNILDMRLCFAKHSRFGYLTCDVCHCGTGLTLSVLMNLPKSIEQPEMMRDICNRFSLVPHVVTVRKGNGVPPDNTKCILIQNQCHLNTSEYNMMRLAEKGLIELIRWERVLNGIKEYFD